LQQRQRTVRIARIVPRSEFNRTDVKLSQLPKNVRERQLAEQWSKDADAHVKKSQRFRVRKHNRRAANIPIGIR
jgi:PAB1-binding protein PBP1